jgi:ferredoxin/flavodoxin---NADP+ reductase
VRVPMHLIRSRRNLAPGIVQIWIDAPAIARKRRPGQFVIVRIDERGERIPLTIADADARLGMICLVVQDVGKTTHRLSTMAPGDSIRDVLGPLGRPTEIVPGARVCCIGGGIGTAVVYPIAAGVRAAGGTVAAIIGGRTRDLVILENRMREVADPCVVTTDDGSYGTKGVVTDALAAVLGAGRELDAVVAVGPVPMMRAVCEMTRPLALKTIVSLNPIMVDGTGMCGGCRVSVAGEQKFVCVDGPEFDGHLVDFAELAARLGTYKEDEALSMAEYTPHVGP